MISEKVDSSVIPAADVREGWLRFHRKYFHDVRGVNRMGFYLAVQRTCTNHQQQSAAEEYILSFPARVKKNQIVYKSRCLFLEGKCHLGLWRHDSSTVLR